MTLLRSLHTGSLVLLSALGIPLATAGCGGDPERPLYEVPAESEQRETQIRTLDDDQLRDICASYSTYLETEVSFDALSSAVCLATSILSTFTPETCEEAYARCIASAPPPLEVKASIEGDAACTQSLRSCDATVGQLEGCINLQLDALVEILDRLACGGDFERARDTAANLMGDLSACADVDAQCTEFTQSPEIL